MSPRLATKFAERDPDLDDDFLYPDLERPRLLYRSSSSVLEQLLGSYSYILCLDLYVLLVERERERPRPERKKDMDMTVCLDWVLLVYVEGTDALTV